MKTLGRAVLCLLCLWLWAEGFEFMLRLASVNPITILSFLMSWVYILGIFFIGSLFGYSLRRES